MNNSFSSESENHSRPAIIVVRQGLAWSWSRLAFALMGTLCLSGCASWKQNDTERQVLPVQRMSPDTVVLEVISVDVPQGLQHYESEIWSNLDDTSLPIDTRRRLADNGLRAGVTSSRLPAKLEELVLLQEQGQELVVENGTKPYEQVGSHQRLQSRMGQTKSFPLCNPKDSVSFFVDNDGYLYGRTVEHAQCSVDMVTYPKPDGSVQLNVTPFIEFGQTKQNSFAVHQGLFVLSSEREREEFEHLAVSAELSSGQTLVLGKSPDGSGIGHLFFGESLNGSGSSQLLLVRLAQTQLDNLFSREQIFTPIETPTE